MTAQAADLSFDELVGCGEDEVSLECLRNVLLLARAFVEGHEASSKSDKAGVRAVHRKPNVKLPVAPRPLTDFDESLSK
jgi:hypothetical protein